MQPNTYIVAGPPVAKPRMTQRDKWKKRKCVVEYRAYSDLIRLRVPASKREDVVGVSWVAYLPIPKSYSSKKAHQIKGQLHDKKPDRDNIDKGVLDALFIDDSKIAYGNLQKRWDDGSGPRLEITLHYTIN